MYLLKAAEYLKKKHNTMTVASVTLKDYTVLSTSCKLILEMFVSSRKCQFCGARNAGLSSCAYILVCIFKLYVLNDKSLNPDYFVPFNFLPLIRVWVAGATAWAGKSRHSSPRPHPPTSPGGHQGVAKPAEKCYVSIMALVCPRVSTRMGMPETPPQGDVQEASWPDAWTTSIGSC